MLRCKAISRKGLACPFTLLTKAVQCTDISNFASLLRLSLPECPISSARGYGFLAFVHLHSTTPFTALSIASPPRLTKTHSPPPISSTHTEQTTLGQIGQFLWLSLFPLDHFLSNLIPILLSPTLSIPISGTAFSIM